MYIGIVLALAGTFGRFIDKFSVPLVWGCNILLIIGTILCLGSVFRYIRPEEDAER